MVSIAFTSTWFSAALMSSGVSINKFKSSKYRLHPHLAYGTPFILASLQILHWHNGLGMLTQPPDPTILIFMLSPPGIDKFSLFV
jgi:hypothetical protein